MKALLDSHTLLWAFTGDSRLGSTAREALLDDDNALYFSIAALWEIAIKASLGKLTMAVGWHQLIEREMAANGIRWLAITPEHCVEVERLPFHHRDPFDRMIIAQALREGMAILGGDSRMDAYGVTRIW